MKASEEKEKAIAERTCEGCNGCTGKVPCAWKEGHIEEDPKECGFLVTALHNNKIGNHFALIAMPKTHEEELELLSTALVHRVAGWYASHGVYPVGIYTQKGAKSGEWDGGLVATPEKIEEIEKVLTAKGTYKPDEKEDLEGVVAADVLPSEVEGRFAEIQKEIHTLLEAVDLAPDDGARAKALEAYEARRGEVQAEMLSLYKTLQDATNDADALAAKEAAYRRENPLGLPRGIVGG